MKKYLSFICIILTLGLYSCTSYITIVKENNQVIYKKNYRFLELEPDYQDVIIFDSCQYKNKEILPFVINNLNCYEFDSVRVYVNQTDTILNRLMKNGLIKGQYFLKNHEYNKCLNTKLWPKPYKSLKHDWYGYHITLRGFYGLEVINEIKRIQVQKEPFFAWAFKIATYPFVGRLAFFRAYSGRLDAGSYILNNRSGKKERISRIYQMHSNKQNAIEYIEAGDIGAAVGFKSIKTGDTLSDEKNPIVLESMDFPDPVIGIAVEPKTKADVDKLGMSLAKLAEEDPTFTARTDEASGQTIISGMGELHLDIIVDRLKREFKVEVNQGQPQVEYKEAVTRVAQHREVYKKQSGGRGKFADIVFTLEPAEEGKEGLEFVSEIKGGNVPKEFIPSVEKGFKEAMKNGPLAGYEVDAMKVTLTDGSYHDVDSDQLSFELAAKLGFKNAAKAAKAVIMEPIMKLEVLTPEENMGDIVGDLNRRRGQVSDMSDRAGAKAVKATVPLSEMFGYVTTLRTLSSGRATSTMEFSHYAETPSNISEEVIAAARGTANV